MKNIPPELFLMIKHKKAMLQTGSDLNPQILRLFVLFPEGVTALPRTRLRFWLLSESCLSALIEEAIIGELFFIARKNPFRRLRNFPIEIKEGEYRNVIRNPSRMRLFRKKEQQRESPGAVHASLQGRMGIVPKRGRRGRAYHPPRQIPQK